MKKRTIEVFSAGCPCCDEAIRLVRDMACPSCDVRVLDMRTDPAAQARARALGVARVPAVAVDGVVAGCCASGGVDAATLRGMGVGTPT
jgi:hypothetical protein